MSAVTDAVRDAVGAGAVGLDPGFGPLVLDVASPSWLAALTAAQAAGADLFDLLTAYDAGQDGLAVVAHVSTPDAADHVLVRTTLPREDAVLGSATSVYRGADWHEREVHEMFGIVFTGHPGLAPLLLAPGAVVHPLRKEVLLAARLDRPWPGDKDPGDSEGRARRRVPPPGVPADHVVPPS